jgi:hypothetical protein
VACAWATTDSCRHALFSATLHRRRHPLAQAAGGISPSGWSFDKVKQLGGCSACYFPVVCARLTAAMQDDWWLEEHGLIMEKPSFPLPVGKYIVTGDREVTTELTIEEGNRWSLKEGAGSHTFDTPNHFAPTKELLPRNSARRHALAVPLCSLHAIVCLGDRGLARQRESR